MDANSKEEKNNESWIYPLRMQALKDGSRAKLEKSHEEKRRNSAHKRGWIKRRRKKERWVHPSRMKAKYIRRKNQRKI